MVIRFTVNFDYMSSSEQIIDYVTRYEQARAHELIHALGISGVAVHKQLKKLVSQGKLKKAGTPPLVLYVLPGVNEKNLIRLEKIKRKVIPILKKADIKKAALFGSYARGEQSHKSDVDILVEYPPKTTLFDVTDLKFKLEDALGKSVDLVGYKTIKPRLKEFILSDQIPIL